MTARTNKSGVYYDRIAAGKFAIVAGLVTGLFAYLVNGHDLVRAGVFALLSLAVAWYGGKVIFSQSAGWRRWY